MMMTPSGDSRLTSRRALEALRNGVPNGDAVAVLGVQPAGGGGGVHGYAGPCCRER